MTTPRTPASFTPTASDEVAAEEGAHASALAQLGWRATVRRLEGALGVAFHHPKRWPAGFCYQFLALGWAFGVVAAVPLLVRTLPQAATFSYGLEDLRSGPAFDHFVRDQWPVLGVLALLLSLRFAPGLARSFFQGAGTEPREPSFALGRGLVLSTAALWLEVVLTMIAASALTIGLLVSLVAMFDVDPAGPLPKVGAGIVLGFLFVYGATLGALYHLALASLVRHRRGAGSALLHAWRLVRAQPTGAARAITVEATLYAVVVSLEWFLPAAARFSGGTTLLVLALCGLTRAGLWSRTYHALGGVDPIPETGP